MKSIVLLSLCSVAFALAGSPLQYEDPPKFYEGQNLKEGGKPPIQAFDTIAPMYKLNDTFEPLLYDLDLLVILDPTDPDIGPELTVNGSVNIIFRVSIPTSTVNLHANLLTNIDPKLYNMSNNAQHIPAVVSQTPPDDDRHFLTLTTNVTLQPLTDYAIRATFVAPVNTQTLDGLYLSWYDTDDGTRKRVAATQMQAYHARQLFPCFDEPGLKATFNVRVHHRSNYTSVLGNGDVNMTEPHPVFPNWTTTVFNPTVPMPTYLFALVISDFNYSEATPGQFDKPVRTYAPPSVIARRGGEYAADIADKLLVYFDEYFNTSYPMQKMDSVHVPHFAAGAMENWGLNLYREAYLIYYPGESLESYKNLLTSVVSHELAHQNFGNRVTCKWWNELWLNEGFATYVSYLGVDGVRPEFRHREYILNDAFQYSMRVDVSARSHPIINDALSPSEIDNYFTGITYEKGGSVNRMTENFLTEQTYRKGLRYYLGNMTDKAVISDDLFLHLDVAASEDNRLPPGLTVKRILDSWTVQKSHPLVRVSVAGPNQVFISQERYADPANVDLWYVPVTIATEDKPKLDTLIPQLWLENDMPMKTWPHDTNKWIMINQNATGYYRVLYDSHLTSLIQTQLENDASVVPPLSRSQLLDDYFNLAFLGHVPMPTALELTKYLEQEDHFTVWEVIFFHLRRVYNYAESDEQFNSFKEYLLPKIQSALSKVKLEYDPAVHIGAEGIHWSKLVDWACSLGDSQCVTYAHQLHDTWENNATQNPIPIDIQASIMCAIVATGERSSYDFIFDKYKETPLTSPVKTRLLNALACASDNGILQETLNMTLTSTSGLHQSHRVPLIQRVAMNHDGRSLVISFLQTRFRDLQNQLGINGINSIFQTLATYISTEQNLDLLVKLTADYGPDLEPIRGSINGGLNTIRSNIAWNVMYGRPIMQWMRNNPPPTPSFAIGVTNNVLITVFAGFVAIVRYIK